MFSILVWHFGFLKFNKVKKKKQKATDFTVGLDADSVQHEAN